jgi:hypothetical protein
MAMAKTRQETRKPGQQNNHRLQQPGKTAAEQAAGIFRSAWPK